MEMKKEDSISLRRLAEMLGVNPSQARKYVLKLGYSPPQSRTADSRGKLTYVFTIEQARQIVETRRQQGFTMGETRGIPVPSEQAGEFYVVQLVPELDPRRVKFGFAANVQERLTQHRTSAPTACILRAWPSRRHWEPMLIDCFASRDCELVLNEVYDCANVAGLLEYGDALFRMLPEAKQRVPLSKASPLGHEVA